MSHVVERAYFFAAWLTHGRSIREAPVRPNAISAIRRALYKSMVDAVRSGAWEREGVDGWMRLVHERGMTGQAVDLVIYFGELYDSIDALDAPTLAAEIEDAYQRRKLESKLLAELEELRAGAPLVPEEEEAA